MIAEDTKRPKLFRLHTNQIVYVHPCCICAKPNAPFGYNSEKPVLGKWKNINWYCHKPCKPPEKPLTQTKLL
jgi:hypothetical protein